MRNTGTNATDFTRIAANLHIMFCKRKRSCFLLLGSFRRSSLSYGTFDWLCSHFLNEFITHTLRLNSFRVPGSQRHENIRQDMRAWRGSRPRRPNHGGHMIGLQPMFPVRLHTWHENSLQHCIFSPNRAT